MPVLTLPTGEIVQFDVEDAERLMAHKWHAINREAHRSRIVYVGATIERKSVLMHRLLLDAAKRVQVDHINGDGLDNRRSNLRFATNSQNQANKRTAPHTSRFKGVSWYARDGRWIVAHRHEGQRIHVGYFDDEIEAAVAYDLSARRLHGEFAALNFPREGEQSAHRETTRETAAPRAEVA